MTIEIGKEYYPVDNSWSIEIPSGNRVIVNKGAGLAGANNVSPVKVKVVSEPIEISFKSTVANDILTRKFRVVEYLGKSYLILNNFSYRID